MDHLGEKKYSLRFPLFTSIVVYLLIEILGDVILKRPNDLGTPAVITTFFLVLYFSFRDAIKGGFVVTIVSIFYFTYFIYSRHASFSVKEGAIGTAFVLTIVYFLITFVVGFLKKTIDDLFAREQQTRINAEQAKEEAEHEKKRLQILLEQLPIGVVIAKSPSGEIISRNKRAIELFGKAINSIKSINDYQNVTAYRNGRKITPEEWPLTRALVKGETVMSEELVITNNKQKKSTLLISAAPIRNKEGNIITAVITFNDITKQKELERQKDDFIAMASHELKTPLTSAKIYAQALRNYIANSPKALNLSEKIHEQIERLSMLIATMLDTTRMEQGKLLLKEEYFVLKNVALKTLTGLQETTNRRILIDWQTHEYFYGNKERISQVFTNLITNAMKFSPAESEIIVKSRKKDRSIIISVQDFGIGIPIKNQTYVFDKFYREDKHKTYPGLGLGLYISSEIVKHHGGKMWVESKEGKGSIFYLSLPISNSHKK